MISVLIPSRGHPEMLVRSVGSLRDLAVLPPEILVAVDEDDPVTIATARELGVDAIFVSPCLGYDRIHEYYNMCSMAARGDWQLVWNDDATMLTDHWDEVIEALSPNVYVADVQSPHSPMCCFPAVRREAVRALGQFSTDNPHVDTFWGDVGYMAKTISRVEVHVDCIATVRGNPHDFYSPRHQAEMVRCAKRLRRNLS